MRFLRKNIRLLLAVAAAACMHTGMRAAPPAPGTLITSQAGLTFIDPVAYVAKDLLSNQVQALVPGGAGLQLVQDRAATLLPGTFFSFPHILTNPGNDTGVYTLTPSALPAGSDQIQGLQLVVDLNGNQIVDTGEPVLPFAPHEVSLAPGATAYFLLVGQVAPGTPLGSLQPSTLRLHAALQGSALTAINTDVITIGGGELQFFKSVSSPTAVRGSLVDFTLSGTNNFPAAIDPLDILIDGAPVNRVVVRDDIPANLRFVEILATNASTALYHRAGDPIHSYTTTPPADLGTVDAVAFAFVTLPPANSFSVGFRVRVGGAASGVIPNVARVYSRQSGVPVITPSNQVVVTVPSVPPTIAYYNNIDFERVIPATRLGSDLFVQVTAGACNVLPDIVEEVVIVITSGLTGDMEEYIGIETGVNTGVFRIIPAVPTADAALNAVISLDGTLQTLARDTLTAEILGCGGVSVTAIILIDPAGTVYDSRTGVPLAGATVTLIDVTGAGNGGNAGGPASVLDEDGVTPVSATQVTLADGEFRFPLVEPSTYRLAVTPPADYSFPSAIPIGLQPAGRLYKLPGSVGGNFPVNLVTGAVFLDVPLDPTTAPGLTLQKEVSRDTAEIGDSVIYTLTLTNTSGADFNFTFIDDQLPFGFRYEKGTTRRDDVAVSDPQGGVGPALRFPLGTLADGAETVITYRVRLIQGAEKGDGINTAVATSFGPPVLISNTATARVRVERGVFDPSGVIFGTVFVDANANDIQDPGEVGVPGVRLILEDGTYAITDGEGQYSIYGQRPVTHVLKLDPHTLPAGAKLGGNSPRFGRDPGSRFVDLKNYELHKANFLLVEPTEAVLAAIETRRRQTDLWKPEISTALATQFSADGTRPLVSDRESRPAAGVVGAGRVLPGSFENILPEGTLTAGNSSIPPSPVAAVPLLDLESLLPSVADGAPGFLDLKDGDTLPFDRATIRIKGPLESSLALLVNGRPAPDSRIGKSVQRAEPPVQLTEYVALQLQPGPNTLEVVVSNLFGNERDRRAISVVAPDRATSLRLQFSNPSPVADGRTPVDVHVTVIDANGTPVTASLPLTLETTLGQWEVNDVNPREPGVQAFLEGGSATYRLLPPIEPGAARLVISSGTLQAQHRLDFLPELRPMVAAGIIEGRFALNRLGRGDLLPIEPADAFEDELRATSGIGGDGRLTGRAAFYLKGKIKGDTLLTIAYDSDKSRDDVKLFRDLDPDAYYPVYGDSSTRGYDAQSTGKLYVRIDKDRSFFLLGDFNTRADSETRQLGDYNRSFNGVRLGHETSRFRGGLWASDDSTTQVIREIPANGTSGPYNFQAGNGLLNSETVEVLVRDRNQTSVILTTTTLTRNVDYDFEPFSGRILLRRPLASVDSNFNPQSLRITYEVETGGERFWVYGGDVQFKPLDRIEVGGSFARDENPLDPYDLQSVNATIDLGRGTYLLAEGARSSSLFPGTGQDDGYAARVDLRHKSEKTEARIHYGETEDTFINPSSQLNSGRAEGGAKVTRVLAPRTQLIGEAIYTADQAGAGNRQGARVDVAHTLVNDVKLTVGARVSEETITPANPAPSAPGAPAAAPVTPISVRSLRVRVDTPVPRHPLASVFAEYEQDVVVADQQIVAAGGNYQVGTKTRLYGRHEFISTLGGPFEINSAQQNNRTVFGVETEYLRDAQFFNEYRVRNAIDGGQSEASTGLRNLWNVAEGLRLNTTLERVTPIDGVGTEESTAATFGFDYTKPVDWKATGRLEGRWADTSDTYLNTFGYARKLNDQWTFLGRSIVNVQLAEAPATADLFQGRLLTGLAWRQTEEDVWNALFRYEYKYEEGSTTLGATDLARQVHTVATSVNYQPDRRWIFSGHYATKFVQETYDVGPGGDYFGHLLAGRALFEINPRWDVGLNLAVGFNDSFANRQWAVGPEIGRIFNKNVRIGLGYNITGFNDRDFDTADTAQGLFLSLRIKFDENLLKWARFDRASASAAKP